jgi:hypothetical protein
MQGIFLFTTASRPALRPTQTPIQWVPVAHSLGIKRPGREADHSPPSSVEVKNAWKYTSTPPLRLYGVVLSLKHGDNFILYKRKHPSSLGVKQRNSGDPGSLLWHEAGFDRVHLEKSGTETGKNWGRKFESR